jgi:transglutaminase-like putative cysteine protease
MNLAAPTRMHVLHETRYRYAAAVSLSQQLLHLTPRLFQFQTCDWHEVTIDPFPEERYLAWDFFGNSTQYIAIVEQHDSLLVRAESMVTLLPRPGQELCRNSIPWESVRDRLRRIGDATILEPLRYLFASPHVTLSDALQFYAQQSFLPNRSVLESALDLTNRIHADFTFDPKATDVSTALSELIITKRGVCQDYAHFMIGCLRAIGLPCRYVSGYILTHPPEGKPRLIGADASHAWVSVYCPSVGWVDFDPTNRCMVNQEHVTLGWGRDFSDVSLLRGVMLGSGEQVLDVSVTVTPQQS